MIADVGDFDALGVEGRHDGDGSLRHDPLPGCASKSKVNCLRVEKSILVSLCERLRRRSWPEPSIRAGATPSPAWSARSGFVRHSELSSRLGVSTVTIRQDIDALSARGLVQRTYGGAIFNSESGLDSPFDARSSLHAEEKRRIGAAAARSIMAGRNRDPRFRLDDHRDRPPTAGRSRHHGRHLRAQCRARSIRAARRDGHRLRGPAERAHSVDSRPADAAAAIRNLRRPAVPRDLRRAFREGPRRSEASRSPRRSGP